MFSYPLIRHDMICVFQHNFTNLFRITLASIVIAFMLNIEGNCRVMLCLPTIFREYDLLQKVRGRERERGEERHKGKETKRGRRSQYGQRYSIVIYRYQAKSVYSTSQRFCIYLAKQNIEGKFQVF